MRLKRHFGLSLLLLTLLTGSLFTWQIIGGHSQKVSADAPCALIGTPDPLGAGASCGSRRENQIHFDGSIDHVSGCNGGAPENLFDGKSVTVCGGDLINVTMNYDVAQTYGGEWDAYMLFNGSNSACSNTPWPGCMSNSVGAAGAVDFRDKNQNPTSDSSPDPYSPTGIVQNNHCPSFFNNTDSPFVDDSVERAGNIWFNRDVTGNHYPDYLFPTPSNGKVSCGTHGQSAIWYGITMNSTGRKTYGLTYRINPNVGKGQSFVIQAGITCGNISTVTEAGCPGITNRTTNIYGTPYVHGGGNLYYATDPQNINVTTDNPPTGCTSNCGTVSCTAFGPDTAYLGQAVGIPVEFHNEAINTDWHLGLFDGTPSSQHSGAITSPIFFATPLDENYTSIGGNDIRMLRHGHFAYPLPNFTVGSPGAAGAVTYTFSIRNDSTGAFWGPINDPAHPVCTKTITWLSNISVDCNSLTLGPGSPSGWYLVRFFPETGGFFDVGAPAGGPYDPFSWVFPGTAPHLRYDVQVFDLYNQSAFLGDASFGRCMNGNCFNSITPPDGLEPGESGTVTFGPNINNFTTSHTFGAGSYYLRATASPQLNLSSPPQTKDIPPGYNPFTGQWNIRPDYTGTLHVDMVFYDGTVVNGFVGLGAGCEDTFTPKSRPIIKVTNGDISTGGGFAYKNAAGNTQCPTAADTARFRAPSSTGDNYTGGIRTFARPSSLKGSGSDFAAYALGLIDGISGGPFGFYTDKAGGNFGELAFANNLPPPGGSNLGGVLGGYNPGFAAGVNVNAHCAPDYFDDTRKSGTDAPVNLPSNNLGGLNTGQYLFKGDLTIPAATVRAGQRITIYVEGNVNIDGDINYANWNFNFGNRNNDSPYLTIVAKGNINVASTVSRIDGLYIAQPDTANLLSSGLFYSCTLAPTFTPATSATITNCQTPLTVNGAVIAYRIFPLRAAGTLSTDGPAAELVNYTPSMILAEPNFKALDSGAVFENSLEGLISLPPVF